MNKFTVCFNGDRIKEVEANFFQIEREAYQDYLIFYIFSGYHGFKKEIIRFNNWDYVEKIENTK